jgi:iron-sulfur cluster repair protein YtfE (RIC family)
MSAIVTRSAWLDRVVVHHHDYVWARLPFVVPMAIAAARRSGAHAIRELARSIIELRPLLLGHLDREERLLAGHDPTALSPSARDDILADHAAVARLLAHIRGITGTDYQVRTGAEATERALFGELALLDDHVRFQIALEEQLLPWQAGGRA